jgi:hypothetical protein
MDSRVVLAIGVSILSAIHLQAQQARQSGKGSDTPRAAASALQPVLATPLMSGKLRVDGRLDDAPWQCAHWISEFTQREPVEGAVPAQRTEVALLFDDDALYIGARMHADSTDRVRALVTRRDVESSSEQFIVSLDTYHDRRTAYSFGVTAAGVRLDYLHPSDKESNRDYSFEPVWTARTAVDDSGWTAEMRIPFSQLRFHRCPAGVNGCSWGVNLTRRIPARNEEDYLVLVRRNETGWASRFADLLGLEDVRGPRRIELLPYTTTEAKLLGDPDLTNPFVRRRAMSTDVGADLKVGLGSSITLNATVNPDFAQVEADPAEVNLTAFETVFPERRPFFVEGSQLLRGGGLTWFNSRRIGQAPRLKLKADYTEKVTSTAIVGAAKVSGRLASGTSVAVLSAVTGPEEARTFKSRTGDYGTSTIEPRTTFGVVRLQQELGKSGSTLGVIFTNVERSLGDVTALRALLPQRASAGAMDWYLRSPGRTYAFSGAAGTSNVMGDQAAMLRIQTSSAHYFQRPDATQRLDSSRTSLFGTYVSGTLEKMAGSWLWSFSGYGESPGLEINDAGKLNAADNWGVAGNLFYRHTTPGRWLHRWELGAQSYQEWNYDTIRQLNYYSLYSNTTWRNFWTAGFSVGTNEPTLRDDLTRGGPLMGHPRELNTGLYVSGNPARKTRWKLSGSYNHDEAGGWGASGGISFAVRPGTRWELSADPYYTQGVWSRQYYTVVPDGSAATYGKRYVFAYLQHNEISTRLRVSVALTPDLTLETYAEPFASSGRYLRYGELPAARSYALRTYGTDGTTLDRFENDSLVVTDGASRFTMYPADYSVLSFNSNVVLRWEWRAGSTAYLVWQQKRGSDTPNGTPVRASALWDALSATGDNILAFKVSYWLSAR